jgi:hypothetical protein
MAKRRKDIKIYIDPVANTFQIFWDDPKKAYSTEEVDAPYRNDIIVKDKTGNPISLEVIGIFPNELNVATRLGTKMPKEPFLLHATS